MPLELLRHVAQLGAAGKLQPRRECTSLLALFYPVGHVQGLLWEDPGAAAWSGLAEQAPAPAAPTRKPARLSIRVSKATKKAIRAAARKAGKSMKHWLMEALQNKGVEIAPADLAEDEDG